ncbi:hypothetical protein [Absidia glauca]|uniref:BZIP domain-containing protein n=1 Tax=Absidia glauca TaxID=4829 RepID=A0A163TF20_ABSGL|nr:hypothetical protein [Absidia glauca]
MNYEGSFLLSSGFLPDGMMNPSSVAATYGTIEAKYEYDQCQPPVSLITASESSSFSGSSFSSGSSSTSPPPTSSSVAYQPLSAAAMGLSSTLTLSPPHIDEDMSSPSLSPPSDTPQSTPPPKKTNHGGRKRSIIFEQAEAEFQRKEFLERNRIAASKCRQKKKKWMKDLETNYEKLSTQNQQLRSMVLLFQEEINALKTELLSRNGLCSCSDMVITEEHRRSEENNAYRNRRIRDDIILTD